MHKKNWKLFYPVLIGIYAAVGLVSVNISQMVFSAGLRSILVATLFSLAVYLVFCWAIKDEHKAALLCAWFMLFFFAFGHLFGALEGIKIFGMVIGRYRFFLPLWLTIFGLGGWWLYTRAGRLGSLGGVLNIASIILLMIPVLQIGIFEWHRQYSVNDTERKPSAIFTQQVPSLVKDQLPDIYYIILDGYPRQDMLLKYHKFDNRGFIKQLEAIGFYVAPCSQSNYALTDLSLASSLNLNYLDALSPDNQAINLADNILHSETRQFLKGLGYDIVSFESGIWYTEFQNADYYINIKRPVISVFLDFAHISAFESLFFKTTLLRIIEAVLRDPQKDAYELILFEYEQLKDAPALPGPKFVFVHILAPHALPFIINAAGVFEVSNSVDPELGNEITYLNKRTLEAVQAIIAGSNKQPIIIIQADHGLDMEVRMANLMAFYFPNGGAKVLYPTITPVNSFRLVFDTYFGQNLPLLPDVSYFAPVKGMFTFTRVNYPCGQ
jgi:hypothetical protein